MGSSLSPEVLEAMAVHLEGMDKEALPKIPGLRRALGYIGEHAKGFLGNVGAAGKNLNPLTLPASYRKMAPRTGVADTLKEFAKSKGRSGAGPVTIKQFEQQAAAAANAPRGKYMKYILPEKVVPRTAFRQGEFMSKLVGSSVPAADIARGVGAAKGLTGPQRIRMMAEEAGRRGWTGQGNITKYLPVGSKGMMAGFSASQIPGIVNAPKATRTGEGSTLERGLGEVGSVGGMIAGTGVGFVPGMAMWGLGQYAGGRAGRTLDRLRAGAGLGEAVNAPSPREAQEQLKTIQRYYGR